MLTSVRGVNLEPCWREQQSKLTIKSTLLPGFNFHAGIWNSISDCTCPVIWLLVGASVWLQRESYRCRQQSLTSLQCRHIWRDPGWGRVCSCRTEWLALAEHEHNWSILSISLLGPAGSCCPTAKFCLRLGLALWKLDWSIKTPC